MGRTRSNGRRARATSPVNRMTCHTKKSTIPKDPSQLSIGLWGPPKKAVSRLKNSHRLDILIIAYPQFMHDRLPYGSRSGKAFSTFVPHATGRISQKPHDLPVPWNLTTRCPAKNAGLVGTFGLSSEEVC